MDLRKDRAAPLTTTRGFTVSRCGPPDSQPLAYTYPPPGQIDDLYVKDIGTGAIQPVIETPMALEHPVAVVPDEESLLVFL